MTRHSSSKQVSCYSTDEAKQLIFITSYDYCLPSTVYFYAWHQQCQSIMRLTGVILCCIQAPGTARPGSRAGAAGGGIGKFVTE